MSGTCPVCGYDGPTEAHRSVDGGDLCLGVKGNPTEAEMRVIQWKYGWILAHPGKSWSEATEAWCQSGAGGLH